MTELVAGLTTFLTISHIVVVNPVIVAGLPGEKPGIVPVNYTPNQVQAMIAVVTILTAVVGTLNFVVRTSSRLILLSLRVRAEARRLRRSVLR